MVDEISCSNAHPDSHVILIIVPGTLMDGDVEEMMECAGGVKGHSRTMIYDT